MKKRTTFLSREDAEKYLNYLVVNIDKQNVVSTFAYHTKEQARQDEAYKYGAEIMTRRQWLKWKEANKENYIFNTND